MNVVNVAQLMNTKKCTYQGCKTKFDEGIIHLKGKYGVDLAWYPDGHYLYHYQDTHGFPHEMMIEELSKIVDQPMNDEEIELYNQSMKDELTKRGIL
jgi:hypothetical protein